MGVHFVVQVKSLHSLEVALTALATFLRTVVTVSSSGLLFQVGDPGSSFREFFPPVTLSFDL